MGLDDNLLNREHSEDEENANSSEDYFSDYDDEEDDDGDYFSSGRLRALKQLNRDQSDNDDQPDDEKKDDKEADNSSSRKAMANLLKEAWLNIIPSFGLSLIWINIHVFLHFVFDKKLFCKPGEEWTLSILHENNINGGSDGSGKDTGKKGTAMDVLKRKISEKSKLEYVAIFFLDLLAILLIIAVFSLIVLLVNAVSNPIEFIATIVGSAIWNVLSK